MIIEMRRLSECNDTLIKDNIGTDNSYKSVDN